jgi:uncharacterized cofD-like protein
MTSPLLPERYLTVGPKIVVAGGGSAATIAGGLMTHLADAHVTVLVSMSDNGGSTGKLREMFHCLPVGDVRRALSALSALPQGARLFEHRFSASDNLRTVTYLADQLLQEIHLASHVPYRYAQIILQKNVPHLAAQLSTLQGHSLGNIVLVSLLKEVHSLTAAAAIAGKWLAIQGRVLPATEVVNTLHMQDGAAHLVGEAAIDHHIVGNARTAKIWLEADEAVSITPEARKVLQSADSILLGPGSLFTSLLPLLEVEGVAEAVRQMQARGGSFMAVCNLVATHETRDLNIADFLERLQKARGGYRFNHVLYNSDLAGVPSGECALLFDASEVAGGYRAIGAQLALAEKVITDPNDPVTTRSVVNHRTDVIAQHVRVILPRQRCRQPVR